MDESQNQRLPPLPPQRESKYLLTTIMVAVALVLVVGIFMVLSSKRANQSAQNINFEDAQYSTDKQMAPENIEQPAQAQKNLSFLYSRVVLGSVKTGEDAKYELYFYDPAHNTNQLIDTVSMPISTDMHYYNGKIYYDDDLHINGMLNQKVQLVVYDIKTKERSVIYESTKGGGRGGLLEGFVFKDNKIYFMECRSKPDDAPPYGRGMDNCAMKSLPLDGVGKAEQLTDLSSTFKTTHSAKFFSPFFGIDSFLFPEDGIVVIENNSDSDIRERYKFSYDYLSFEKLTDSDVAKIKSTSKNLPEYRCSQDTEASGILASVVTEKGSYPAHRIGCFDSAELAGLIVK